MNKTLLFPTDFSEVSINALRETIRFNKLLQYDLLIVHAYSRPGSEKAGSSALKAREYRIEQKYERLVEAVPELKEMPHNFMKLLGYSTDKILEAVSKSEVGLIVMGTKGAVGVNELFGTKTEEVIQKSTVPVIVIPKNGSLTDIRRIGLASDFSKTTDYAKIEFLIHLAERIKKEVVIVTLNREEKDMSKSELKLQAEVLKKMKNISSGVEYVFDTNKERGLVEFCKRNDIGLVGFLPKSYNFIENLFHESMTRRMAYQSPVPLLVLK